jgi:hypothetical protein
MPAFGQTRLQIINAVLPRLRENPVATSSSTTYAALVASVLNVVKTQIEQAWQWRALRDTYSVTVVPGTTTYALTGAGPAAQIYDAWNRTTNQELERGTTRGFNEKFFGTTTVQTGDVTEYNPVGLNASYDVQIDTWPNVTSTNLLKINVYVPQPDPDDDNDPVLVPSQVLIEGILSYMIAERGDDGGLAAQTQKQIYDDLLAGAIAAEVSQDSSEGDWNAV